MKEVPLPSMAGCPERDERCWLDNGSPTPEKVTDVGDVGEGRY